MKEINLKVYKHKAKESTSSKELFHIWDLVSTSYEDGLIDRATLNEMKSIIYPMLSTISRLRKQINQAMLSS